LRQLAVYGGLPYFSISDFTLGKMFVAGGAGSGVSFSPQNGKRQRAVEGARWQQAWIIAPTIINIITTSDRRENQLIERGNTAPQREQRRASGCA
jgi:hypothetical protein